MKKRARGSGAASGPRRGGSTGAKKKLVIRALKAPPKLPDDFADKTWAALQSAVRAVYAGSPIEASREELYRMVHDLCTNKKAQWLYGQLKAEVDAHAGSLVGDLRQRTPDTTAFLALVQATWRRFTEQMLAIRSIFLHLDRSYVLHLGSVKSLWDMATQLFCAHFEAASEVADKSVQGMLALVARERQGESVDHGLLASLSRMLQSLHIYKSALEPRLLDESRSFYDAEGKRLIESTDAAHYLQLVDSRMQSEAQRVRAYLDPETRKPLIQVLDDWLLQPHLGAIVDKGFAPLLDGAKIDDLSRMYSLFARVDATQRVCTAFSAYIVERAKAAVATPEKDKEMVTTLLELKTRTDKALREAFQGSHDFLMASKSAYEEAINSRVDRPAEMLAKYVDSQLRSGNKGASDADIEKRLDEVMDLFRFISAKDVFEEFYKKDLAKRLLLGKSASADLEKVMLQKLKNECGASFTSKLEGMFNDMEASRTMMTTFQETQKAKDIAQERVDAHVHVLTHSYWPPYPPIDITLPPQLQWLQDSFLAFYQQQFSSRKLAWQHGLGTCVLKARFPKGRKELSVSLMQATVLFQFNGADTVTFPTLQENTGMTASDLKRTLQSLACGKVRVLKKTNKTVDVADDEPFHFNKGFSSKLLRLKVNAVQMKETRAEKEATDKHVERNRQYQIDAALVRIMKTRKQLSHQLLLSEVFQQLRFPAKAKDVKKRIESLIEREYLERDEEIPSMYNYLA